MATAEQLKIAREKALQSPRIGKRGKGAKTIAKEQRQAIFDEFVSQEFLDLIKEARAEYKLDRFMGKIPETLKVEGEVRTTIVPEILAKAEEELKKRKTSEESI